MKKITMLLAAIGVAASTVSFAQENVEYMPHSYPYAKLKAGGTWPGTLDELCFVLAEDSQTEYTKAIEAEFIGFVSGREGDRVRKLACNIKWLNGTREYHGGPITWKPQPPDGSFSPSSPWGPIECLEGFGGLYSQLPSPYDRNVCHSKVINK